MREFLYRVLCEEAVGALRRLLFGSEARTQIHRVLERFHQTYSRKIDMSEMAREMGMSSSSLHHHVKGCNLDIPRALPQAAATAQSPSILQNGLHAAEAAERVGYASASQFSREFKRLSVTHPGVKLRSYAPL